MAKKTNQLKLEHGGAVLILFVGLCLLMAMFLSYSFFTTNQKIAKEELQAAVDAAALAGVKELCHSSTCYQNSRNRALNTLINYTSRNSLGIKRNLLTPAEAANFSGTSSDVTIENDRIKITIERGRWTKDITGKEIFESLDITPAGEAPWSERHPAVPRVMVANAVRVNIQLDSPFSFLGGKAMGKMSSAATAVWGEAKISTCAAPFAIPLCALLDRNGNFDSSKNCSADRFFTSADRYCDKAREISAEDDLFPEDDCHIRPSFIYTLEEAISPSSLGINSAASTLAECSINRDSPRPLTFLPWLHPSNLAVHDSDDYTSVDQIPVGWCTPTVDRVQDHFAVIGINESNSDDSALTAEEALDFVRNYDSSDCRVMTIGENFQILGEGFRNLDSSSANEWEQTLVSKVMRNYAPEPNTIGIKALPFGTAALEGDALPIDETLFNAGGYILSSQQAMSSVKILNSEEDLPKIGDQALNITPENEINVPNMIPRSAVNNGLCRSYKAKLKCGTTNTPEFNVDDFNSAQLKFHSMHYPPQLAFLDVPAKSPSMTPENHACNLNNQQKFKEYAEKVNQLTAKSCAGELAKNCENVISQEILDLRLEELKNEKFYSNLKVFPNNGTNHMALNNNNFWKVKVPVIANFSDQATTCSSDPALVRNLDPIGDFRIIGFVDVQIFDFDITGEAAIDENGNNLVFGDGPFPTGSGNFGPANWYFSINNEALPCNLIRGRVACEANFLPSASASYDPEFVRPVLRE